MVSIRGRAARRWAAFAAILFVVTACGSNQQPSTELAWHLSAMHANPQRTWGLGDGVVIAFIDSGFTGAGLSAFANRHEAGVNELGGRADQDVNGHGTEMAVIAAGGGDLGVWGVAPHAEVMPVVVADEFGHASPRAVAAGITWAAEHGATIINISLAADVASEGVADAVERAIGAGSVVVVSAGDIGDVGPEFPASLPGVVAVYGQNRDGQIGPHSNVPQGISAMAPGEGIETLAPTSNGLRRVMANGTSAAAAIVSGLLAACLSVRDLNHSSDRSRGLRCERLLYQHTNRFLDLRSFMEVAK